MKKKYVSQALHERRECLCCHKPFITNNAKQRYCSRKCQHRQSQRKVRGSDLDLMRQGNNATTDEGHAVRIRLIYSRFEYIGGWEKRSAYFMCKDCGHVFKHSIEHTKPSHPHSMKCPECQKLEREIEQETRKAEKQQAQEKARQEKEHQKLLSLKGKQETIKVCPVCNSLHVCRSKYCSSKCAEYLSRKVHDDRRIRRMSNKGDTTISLIGLISRQGKRCAICGEPVDMHDYEIRGQVFIAGNNYPSIDHIIPLAKGGAHRWDNVQVAHRICNSIKNDKIV